MERMISAIGRMVTPSEPSWCRAGHHDWRAPSVLPPRVTWTIGPHNHPPILLPLLLTAHPAACDSSRLGGQAQPRPWYPMVHGRAEVGKVDRPDPASPHSDTTIIACRC
jgi:hypothetical protein